MSTSRSKEIVESTGATAIKDEVEDAIEDKSYPNDVTELLQTGSMRPDLDSGVLDSRFHWGSERPENYEYLIHKLQKKRKSPPPCEELYESFKFAAVTMNGNDSSIVNAAKVFFKYWDNIDENETKNYGQIVQREGKSAKQLLIGALRYGEKYLELSYERLGEAADITKDERTRSSEHSAVGSTPSGTSFGCEAARVRYIGACLVAERRVYFYSRKGSSPKDHAHVISFIMSESRVTLFANFGRTGSNVEYNVGNYTEYHMSELLCLPLATSYETFKKAWTVLRNAEEHSKRYNFEIDLESIKSMPVRWKAFKAKKKYEASEEFLLALDRRRMVAIEAWRSEEEMIQSRRDLNGMGPEDRDAYFKLQQVRYD